MSFLKLLGFLTVAGEFLTLAGRLLVGASKIAGRSDQNTSQDSSIPSNGEEDEKPAENETPFDYEDY